MHKTLLHPGSPRLYENENENGKGSGNGNVPEVGNLIIDTNSVTAVTAKSRKRSERAEKVSENGLKDMDPAHAEGITQGMVVATQERLHQMGTSAKRRPTGEGGTITTFSPWKRTSVVQESAWPETPYRPPL